MESHHSMYLFVIVPISIASNGMGNDEENSIIQLIPYKSMDIY